MIYSSVGRRVGGRTVAAVTAIAMAAEEVHQRAVHAGTVRRSRRMFMSNRVQSMPSFRDRSARGADLYRKDRY
jgi:hypothetical protein